MLCELSVLDSVELKGHRVDLSASGFEANEFAFVRAADGIQDSDAVALSHDRRNRQLQIRKGGAKPSKVLLEGFPPGTLPSQMIVVILRDDLVEHSEVPAFDGREKTPYKRFVLFDSLWHAALLDRHFRNTGVGPHPGRRSPAASLLCLTSRRSHS